MTACKNIVPSILACTASGGYAGFTWQTSRPCATPEDTRTFVGAATGVIQGDSIYGTALDTISISARNCLPILVRQFGLGFDRAGQ